MGNGKAGAIGEILGRSDAEIGPDCPVQSKKKRHNSKNRSVIEPREAEQDEPKSSSCLLYLDMTGRKDGAQLCLLLECNKKNVQDKRKKQKKHNGRERTAGNECRSIWICHTRLNGILTKIGVNNHCRKVEALFKTNKNRAE